MMSDFKKQIKSGMEMKFAIHVRLKDKLANK